VAAQNGSDAQVGCPCVPDYAIRCGFCFLAREVEKQLRHICPAYIGLNRLARKPGRSYLKGKYRSGRLPLA